ncbi:hypothetical protein SASPL_127884 [Salvia splendens]|uniref:Treslin n=1 Tax=Salvia splendens TaxID=180675 RepID=A0A8X8ZLZ4_SALSN|nr:uncharacterized protein LOC121752904 [Salvia splendens]KAG6409842.1 hypothetical protein SASPL_127884 [Salvia splendens]
MSQPSMANRQSLDFSKTQRVVLLIDLDPILTLQNPSPYFSSIISAANRLLRFPPLAATLSAFKLFFSSLSPLRCAAALPRDLSTHSLSFNLPQETLESLSTTLNCISSSDLPNSACCPRASNAASSLLQLVHDYAWESEQYKLSGDGEFLDGGFVKIHSNLVLLFSPIGQSVNSLVDYLELREFNGAFCAVREAFSARDIHLCWVDVKIEIDEKKNECGDNLVTIRDGIRKIGWGFCSSDFIVLCSVLLPLGLIYPQIGLSFDFADFSGIRRRKYSGELNLEILDVKGKPLECKFCDLELVILKSLPCTIETDDIFNGAESRDSHSFFSRNAFWAQFGEGTMKLHVKSVHSYDVQENTGGTSDIILVRECFQESQKNKKKNGADLFSDRVLEILHEEMGGLACRDQLPTWQMFLSFLHMNGYWASISLSSSKGDTLVGSLKPLAAHLAVLHISDAGSLRGRSGFDGASRDFCIEEMIDSNTCSGSQTDASTSGNCKQYGDGKRKRSQRHLYQEMTWSSFRKAAFEGSNFDLFELYTARYLEKSKKLKFLKCWMKHISKVEESFLKLLPGIKSMGETSGFNVLPSKCSPVQEEVVPVSKVETQDAFLNILSKRIRHGLESGMDLQKLAERVVKFSIHWLHKKHESEVNTEAQPRESTSDDPKSEDVVGKLIKLLLRSPTEMKEVHQNPSSSLSSEAIVREYELQILLRMEILRSDVAALIRESSKRKLLKQICSQLEIIQFLVAGGIHGHISLYDYVEHTITARYSDKLEDVVKDIYTEMDLLPFGEEDEAPSLLFNSEDSSQSWRDKHDRNDKGEANNLNHSVSAEGESSQSLTSMHISLQESGIDDYARSLNEARERREKARRFAPFVSRALDLQRVWAPKQQPKATKCKYDPRPNKSKRKDRHTRSYSVVCETPMTGNKRACSGAGTHDLGSSSFSTVSKALFQDN